MQPMHSLKARVQNGRLVLDEPTDLPEGAEVELAIVEDALTEAERARLHAALELSIAQADAAQVVPAERVLGKLLGRG